MSDYGADKNPDLNIATEITKTECVLQNDDANVMQWTYADGHISQKYASRRDKSNLHVRFKAP